MKKTLLTLVAGASIGAGTVVTLPDGSTATAELPTSSEIYDNETVSVLKLILTEEDGKAARYIIEKTSSIDGVAPSSVNGFETGVDDTWNAVSTATKEACDAEAECVWTSLEAARNNGDVTSSTLVGGKIINVEKEIPAVTALKQKLLEEN